MKKKQPSERLLELVTPHIIKKGFEYKKSLKAFVRKFQFGRQQFFLSFSGKGGLTIVNCGFFIYFDELIKLHAQILDIKTGLWSYQIGTNSLSGFDTIFKDLTTGFLFDERWGNLTPAEKSTYSSDEIHPDYKIAQGADFVLKAFEIYAEHHFAQINNYEILYDAFIHGVRMRLKNKTHPLFEPYLNLNIRYNEEKLVYDALILAFCLDKDTTEINELAQDILNRYTVRVDEIKANIQKIFDAGRAGNLKIFM
jgi:hypothetical protein